MPSARRRRTHSRVGGGDPSRNFADKREVLLGSRWRTAPRDGGGLLEGEVHSSALEEKALAALDGAPATASALDTVAAVLDTVAQMVGGDRELARKRQAVRVSTTAGLSGRLQSI